MTVKNELDIIQEYLHDGGTLWPRTELVRWWNDGYRKFLAQSAATRRFSIVDLPPRFAMTYTFDWESRYATERSWRWSKPVADTSKQAAFLWEVEQLEGISPTNSAQAVTQLWERTHTGDLDQHYRFALPKDVTRIKRVAWDDRLLTPVAVKELDETDDAWHQEGGEPIVWTPGLGRVRTLEIFEIRTDYQQGYTLELADRGLPRQLSGDRTYGVSVTGHDPTNSYGYSTSADSDALVGPSYDFAPTSGFTHTGDVLHGIGSVPYRFTLDGDLSPDTPGLGYAATQPWEINSRDAGRTVCIFPWEQAHGGQTYVNADTRPTLEGFGWRFTKVAATVSNGFGSQTWEKEQLDGATSFTDGPAGGIGTYAWESEFGAPALTFGLGAVRGVDSPDRQYLPVLMGAAAGRLLGTIRDWRSSADALTVWHTVIPHQELGESDVPDLLPSQLLPHLRHHVWSLTFLRPGEGHQPALGRVFEQRFTLGIDRFRRMGDVARRDRVYARESQVRISRRPPRVRLPAEFPRVLR